MSTLTMPMRLAVTTSVIAASVAAVGCGAGSDRTEPNREDGRGDGAPATDGVATDDGEDAQTSPYDPDANVHDSGCLGPLDDPKPECEAGQSIYVCTFEVPPPSPHCSPLRAITDGDVIPHVYCCAK